MKEKLSVGSLGFYLILTMIIWATVQAVAHLYIPVHEWFLLTGVWFNVTLIVSIYFVMMLLGEGARYFRNLKR